MKRPEYVSIVTSVYAAAMREHREPTEREMADLTAAFSRSGFTQGYFLDEQGPAMFGTRQESENTDALFAAARESYRKDVPLVPVSVTFSAHPGQPIRCALSDENGHTISRSGPIPEAALHRAATADEISAQLSKTGGTPYFVTETHVDLSDGLSIPKSTLNGLRRSLLEELSTLRKQPPARRVCLDEDGPLLPPERPAPDVDAPRLIFTLRRADQLTPALWALPHRRIDLPLEELLSAQSLVAQALAEGARLCAQLPRICWDEEKPALLENLQALAALGVSDVLAPTWDTVRPARDLGFTLHGDFGLGVCNRQTLKALQEQGFQDATLSFELKTPQLRDLAKEFDCDAICYGRLPLMALEQFPGGQPTQTLTDRLGVTFPVLPLPGGRAELLNSQTLYLADKPDFAALPLSGLRLLFTTEPADRCPAIAREYLGLTPATPPKNFTRGLYYRDVD